MTYPGLMQRSPLNISKIIDFAALAHSDREIVSRNVDEPIWRSDYAGTARRAAQGAHWLTSMGIKLHGTIIAILSCSSQCQG
jgi:3-(methylthio)propionyl---CoA ligase